MVPNTLFIGQQLYFLPECESTNTVAQQLLIKNEATEGCTIVTTHQTQGRGQRGNIWEAEPSKNITLSVILSPTFVAVRQQFYLNMAISLGVLDLLREQRLDDAKIKWPNDLYFEDKKLGGILIENTINSSFLQHSIVGIGLNVNQQQFTFTTATSLAVCLETTFNIEELVIRLLELLEKRYLELHNGKTEKLKYEYLQALFRFQEKHVFLINNKPVQGQIVGVMDDGHLAVEIDGVLKYFAFKEIAYVL